MATQQKDVFAEPKRLSAIAPAGDAIPLEDLAGRDLILLAMEPITSDRFGEPRTGYRCSLEEPDHSASYIAMVFGVVAAAQLAKVPEQDLPMIVRFEKSGRAWVIV